MTSIEITEIIGCVIAGGRSKRMGLDKKYLLYKNITFMQRAVDLLKNTCHKIIINSPDSHNSYNNITDKIANKGPLGGIYSVFSYLQENYQTVNSLVVFIPIDMPNLSETILKVLIKAGQKYINTNNLAVNFKGFIFPFITIYNETSLNIVQDSLYKDNLALKNLLTLLTSKEVLLPNNFSIKSLINVNNITEYNKL